MKIIKVKNLNEAIEDLADKYYGVMDHNLANAVKDEKENKQKASDMMEKSLKEFPVEGRDAHTKGIKTPEMKKMYLSESLFESWNEDLIHDVYNALVEIAFEYSKKGTILTVEDFEQAFDWFSTHFEDKDLDQELNGSINGNTSHTEEFISALRSAGFGDGFDQKLKIDTYGNGGTRVEFKDQGGRFVVTITDDKVIFEGQDEGEKPFKKEYVKWPEFVNEFNELYPGIPVGENLEDSQRFPVEGTKQVDLTLNESSYKRTDGAVMLVKQKRESLVDVILMALSEGEQGYVKSPDGTITPSKLPHLDYDPEDTGVAFDKDGRYFIRVWDTSESNLQKVVDIANQFNREYKIGFDKYAAGNKKWYCLIYLNEDTDFDDPYVDPNAEVNYEGIKGRGTKTRGNPNARHAKDNEDLEDSQRYPIESPAPAQTGLLNESNLKEDVQMNGSLMEDTIFTDMIHDFVPNNEEAATTFNRILEAGKMDTFEFMLEDLYPQGIESDKLNDLLAYENQWIYDQLGMKEFINPEIEE